MPGYLVIFQGPGLMRGWAKETKFLAAKASARRAAGVKHGGEWLAYELPGLLQDYWVNEDTGGIGFYGASTPPPVLIECLLGGELFKGAAARQRVEGRNPGAAEARIAQLERVIRALLDTAELNQDDLEDETEAVLGEAEAVLSAKLP